MPRVPRIVYTKHAKQRLKQRGIDRDSARDCVLAAHALGLVPDETDGRRIAVQFGKRRVVVVSKKDGKRTSIIVITVLDSSKRPISRHDRNKRHRRQNRKVHHE